MAMRYGYFDSEITGVDSDGMPILDRAENSELIRLIFSKILRDGVLAKPADSFQVIAGDSGLTVKIRPGFGLIRGAFAYDEAEEVMALHPAPTSYSRIDRVVLRCNYLQRLCEIIIKTGTPASDPVAPELLQPASGDYYELSLATVKIIANQTAVTQSAITDTRADSRVCGFITQLIDSIDTSVFSEQLNAYIKEFRLESSQKFEQWFNGIKGQLGEDAAGHLQNQIDDALQQLKKLSMDAVVLTGQEGKKVRFGIDAKGRYGYIKDGADSVTPFRNPTGHAVKEHVLEGEIFSTAEGEDLVGTMKNLPGSEFAKGIQNTAESIWLGMTAGAHITNDKDMGMPCVGIKRRELGNADSVDVLKGKTFTSVIGLKVAGTIEDYTDKVYTVTTTEEGGSGTITANIPDGLHREIKINQKAAFDAGKEYAAQHLPFSLLKVIEVGSGASYKTEAWFGAIVVAGIDQMTVTPGFTKLGGSKCLFYRADVPKGTTISISTTYNTDCSIIGVW